MLKRSRERYIANRENRLAQSKQYAITHPEVRENAWRKYQTINKDKCRQQNREYYQRNLKAQRERCARKNKKNYQRDRLKILEANRKWRQANREHVRAKTMKRKALLLGAAVNLKRIKEWMASVKSRPTATCYYCSCEIQSRLVHFDHIVALSKGGPHSIENLCVSCAACNLSKKAKSISAWVRIGQQVLSL